MSPTPFEPMASADPARTVPTVAVVGAGDASDTNRADAREVGRGLAAAGVTIVCGGLGGVMAAACAGAHEADGTTIGILPGLDRAVANDDVDVVLPTGLGEGRNVLVVRAADAVVAVGGAYGTLSEIALALRAGLPVVGLRTWELVRDGAVDSGIVPAEEAAQAVTMVLTMVGRGA